jgi:rhodanese-related sulfurtransferase
MSSFKVPSLVRRLSLDLWRELLILVALALVSGWAINIFRPEGALPLSYNPASPEQASPALQALGISEFSSPEELESLLALPGAILLDAREPVLFELGRIPQALNLPASQIDTRLEPFLAITRDNYNPEGPIIVYCSDPLCPLANRLAEALVRAGLTNIHLFSPGFDGWLDLGKPIEK